MINQNQITPVFIVVNNQCCIDELKSDKLN